jgi:hypothetical protein
MTWLGRARCPLRNVKQQFYVRRLDGSWAGAENGLCNDSLSEQEVLRAPEAFIRSSAAWIANALSQIRRVASVCTFGSKAKAELHCGKLALVITQYDNQSPHLYSAAVGWRPVRSFGQAASSRLHLCCE